MGITIRPWKTSDLESIRRITWQSWMATYTDFIPEKDLKDYFDTYYTEGSLLPAFDNPFAQGFIAEMDGQIAGYARLLLQGDENRLYVSSLYFHPDFQGKGMGLQLLKKAERYALARGLDRIWIGVMVKNKPALHFYRKAGFQFIREEPFAMGNTTVSHLIGYKGLGKGTRLDKKIYARFDEKEHSKDLSALCLQLLSEQKTTWEDLRTGYQLLESVRERELACRGFSVRLQHNAGRSKSSLADVHEGNRIQGNCFLCLDRLPDEQKGVLYRGDFLILCNPMPVFHSHFTISHLDHRQQAIGEHFSSFLNLMTDFGSDWMILYNGPKCGASAPDHLHFQAIPSGRIPVEKEIREAKNLFLEKQIQNVFLYRFRRGERDVLLLEGEDPVHMENIFNRFLNALKKVLLKDEEPLLNLAGFYEKKKWRLIVFPRQKHRPDAFFREGDHRIVASPGAIDMGGTLILPMEKDFERLDETSAEDIYKEVSLNGEIIERAIQEI